MTDFHHEVRETEVTTKRTHTWSAEFPDFRIEITRDEVDEIVSVEIAPQGHFRGRIPFLRLSPTSAADLESFATHGPDLLRAVARHVTAALGSDDWRSRWDKQRDELAERFGIKREHMGW